MSLLHRLRSRRGMASARLSATGTGAPAGLSPHWLNFSVAVWFVLAMNLPFWRAAFTAAGGWDAGQLTFVVSLPLAVLVFVWLALEALTWGHLAKPVLAVLLVAAAAANHFALRYGVMIDREMLANIAQTDLAEATELFEWRLLAWIALLGVLPALLLWRVPVQRRPWRGFLLRKGAVLVLLALALCAVLMSQFKSYAALARNHRELRLQLVPTNMLAAAYSYARALRAATLTLDPVGTDAVGRAVPASGKPRLLVVLVGETARASNFGLLGYARDTNPVLAREPGLFAFRDVTACGTNTATSLPCMFLDVGRAGFSADLARRRENVLDVLQRAGVAVAWRDNNSGCKGICDRVASEDVSRARIKGLCTDQECWDEILLDGLQRRLDATRGDTVVVLHMKGSHGPAYYLRYPPAFEHFQPVCRSNQLDRCARETIVNAYDNSVRYTDFVTARTIALLRDNAGRFDTAMLYVSDHGESLGEKGLYLHGVPYAIAPSEQTRIPMLLWIGPDNSASWQFDATCVRRQTLRPQSHDNLPATLLGLMGVRTSVYRPEQDVLQPCRGEP